MLQSTQLNNRLTCGDIVPKFQKNFPKDAIKYFDPAYDEEFKSKHPIKYTLLVIIGITALLLPMFVFILLMIFVLPKVNSGWLVLVYIGCFIIGIGLFNIVAAFINQYLGHLVTFGCLILGGALIAISCVILYVPDIYSLFDEEIVSFYFISLMFLCIPPIFYIMFRYAMSSYLDRQKIRRSKINRLMKGKRNYWWYEAIHEEYGLGFIYYLNKFVTIAYPIGAILSITLNFIRAVCPVTGVINSLVCVAIAVMLVFEMMESNRESYSKPFILLRITENKRLDSSIFQLFTPAFMLAIAYCYVKLVYELII